MRLCSTKRRRGTPRPRRQGGTCSTPPRTPAQRRCFSKLSLALEAGDIDAAVAMFARKATGATSSPSPGTSRQSRAATKSATCSAPASPHVEAAELARRRGESVDGGRRRDGGAGSRFETEVARGYGLVRAQGRQIWTLLTTLVELKGHEEKPGFTRPLGAKHGVNRRRQELEGASARRRPRRSATPSSPTCLIVGGGQGGIGARRAAAAARRPTIIVEKNERPGDSWRKRYKSLCLHDPGLVRPPALPAVPDELAGVLAQGQDRRLARDVRQGDGAQLLGLDRCKSAEIRRRRRRNGPSSSSATASEVTLRPKQLVFATGMSAKPNMPKFPGMETLQGRPAPFLASIPARTPTRARRRGHRLQQFRARHLRGAVGERRRRDDGAALLDPYRALGLADGDRPRRALFRAGGAERHRPPTRPT